MRFGTMNFTKVMAMAAGLAIVLMPVTASAAEVENDTEVVVDAQVVENEVANIDIEVANDVVTDDTTLTTDVDVLEFVTGEIADDADAVTADTTEVVDTNSLDDDNENSGEENAIVVDDATADNNDEIIDANENADAIVEAVVEAADDNVTVEAAETVETEKSTPVFDQKAVKWLKTAAKCNEQLSDNSFSTGLAAFNQVSRCRELAVKLLTFKYNYLDGMMVIGHSYDMNLGDNNYIMVEMKDTKTGEIIDKYFDFYMQDSNGNNVTNMFKYHTVDRIVIVEKGELTGEKKLGMYVHPTFASKSNGNVVFDIDSYSKLISDEYISYVEKSVN